MKPQTRRTLFSSDENSPPSILGGDERRGRGGYVELRREVEVEERRAVERPGALFVFSLFLPFIIALTVTQGTALSLVRVLLDSYQ